MHPMEAVAEEETREGIPEETQEEETPQATQEEETDKLCLWHRERRGVLQTDGLAGVMQPHDSFTIMPLTHLWTG
jgi:hypothetical protein